MEAGPDGKSTAPEGKMMSREQHKEQQFMCRLTAGAAKRQGIKSLRRDAVKAALLHRRLARRAD